MKRVDRDNPAQFADLSVLEVNADQLAHLFGVGKKTVLHYAREAGMPRIARGRYKLADCVQWYIEKQRNLMSGDGDLTDERKKLITAQRQRHEIEAARLRGELIDAEAVATCFNELGVIFSTQLEGFGARVAPRLVNKPDVGEIRRIIHDEARNIRRSTSTVVQAFASDYPNVKDYRTTAET